MFLLFFPIALVIAMIVGAIALLASTGAWPLLLIALGLWLLMRQGNRRLSPYADARGWHGDADVRGRAREWRERPEGARERSAQPAPQRPAPPAPGPELPADLQAKADRIRRKVDELVAQAHRFPPYSPDLYLVRQTGADYLPGTIRAYLSLPVGVAERAMDGTGKSAHQELGEQLDLLEAKLDDIATHLHARELDPLLANRRFLEERLDQGN